jgi:type IV secretion system protein VirB5
MPFLHKSTTYKPLPAGNPFAEGQDKAYADILAGAIRDKNFWRNVVGGGSLALSACSFAFFVYAVSLQKTVPVLINVMPNGEAQYIGEVKAGSAVQVPESAVIYQVRLFVTSLRSVSVDPQVLYSNINACYAMATASYEPVLTRSLRSSSPFDLIGKVRRTVEIESVLKITGATYQIDWYETVIDAQARQTRARFRALATIKILPPGEDTVKKNPLGIYIDNFEMTGL